MDFGALPPEINSGRIYSGPGPAPLLAAAAAWDGLASELRATAASYGSVVAELRTAWNGPSSTSMAAAAAPYVAWLIGSAAQAEQSASQAKAAAGAYDAVFAATVPPPVIAANRALLASLVATNILGQNTPAIAATEAQYAEMWAQDAAAMYGYAGSSAAATQLAPFTAPPTTTDSGAETNQAAAVASAAQSSASSNVESTVSQALSQAPAATQTAATATTSPGISLGLGEATGGLKSFNNFLNVLTGPYSPIGIGTAGKGFYQLALNVRGMGANLRSIGGTLHPKGLHGVLAPLLHSDLLTGSTSFQPPSAGTVSAAVGRAGVVGSLSVPANWASAAPAIRTLAAELPETMLDAAPAMTVNPGQGLFGPTALSSLAGRAVGGSATRAVAGPAVRVPGAVAVDDIATTSTVIVIPPNAK
ncbi:MULTISPECIES: PPE family protein [Mycobacterium]|uniref:PPE family protein n=2 Tax=Mycobacterium avium complex (MAC) TaxID=120793 RepID=A0ABN6AYJ1_9MYCO|nr:MULTISPECIES: PPE family protein [Mycobacterium]ASW85669.1 PPE family protein [Mycobacterium intracellulare]MCA2305212.1 PPE family protein [Mycobacterium intracellulare]MCA2347426.1 PPE family protein [Mycobacterium intracellulare]OSC30022.1 PPE family protein [Mycobacterium paraintracellulare]PBA63376.1 PPE family protein [Mycobacterium intracellulare subsp. chimaera]